MFYQPYQLLFAALFLISGKVHLSEANPVQESQKSCQEETTAIVRAINSFGFKISQQIQDSGNMFISPLGLKMALGMAYLGAQGKTAQQMETVFDYKSLADTDTKVHESIRDLCVKLTEQSNSLYTLKVANSFFSQLGVNIQQSYRDNIHAYYHATTESLDFANQPVEAMNSVNEWASENTDEKIKNFLTEPLPTDTQVLLIDALYFKGTWKIQFPVANTYEGYFYTDDGSKDVLVPLMTLSKETFPYLKDEESGYKYMELPYEGGEVSMILAQPLQYNQHPDLNMTNELLCRITSSMSPTELETVIIPKFKLEYEKSMKDPLKEMGMVDAFQIGVANFSGIRDGLHASDVLHKAVIEVNEQGSEAAAISGILIRPVSFREIDEFIANRPFLFYILHKGTGLILFSGKVVTPGEI